MNRKGGGSEMQGFSTTLTSNLKNSLDESDVQYSSTKLRPNRAKPTHSIPRFDFGFKKE